MMTADLMARQASIAKSLRRWPNRLRNCSDEGELALAWVNLGTIAEGALKVYYGVFYTHWMDDDHVPQKNGKTLLPSDTFFDKMIIFSEKRALFDADTIAFLRRLRDQRNLIHPLKKGEIKGFDEFLDSLRITASFLENIENRLPYP